MPAVFNHMSWNEKITPSNQSENTLLHGDAIPSSPGQVLLIDIIALAEAISNKSASPLVSDGALADPAAPLPATMTCLVLARGHPEAAAELLMIAF